MSPRVVAAVAALALAPAAAAPLVSAPAAAASAAGIGWSVPGRWTSGTGNSMRVATYGVPGAKGAEAGECAVFFFGPGQGGGVDENVERWTGQFEGEAKAARTDRASVDGLKLTRVQFDGTYLAPGGPAMQSTGKREGYRLLGAIVEAPEGLVFFKLTGPAATLGAAAAEFDGLVASIRKR